MVNQDIIYNLPCQMILIYHKEKYKDFNQFTSLFNNTNKMLKKNKNYNIQQQVHKQLLKDLLL